MAKPKYRLQVLLDIREKERDKKQDELRIVREKLRNEQLELERRRKEHQNMKDRRAEKEQELFSKMQSGQFGINGYLEGERFLKRLDKEIEDYLPVIKEQEKVVLFAEQEVEWAFEELMKAEQELKALEKHKDKKMAEIKAERMAKEEAAAEEVATTIFLFKDR